MKGVSGSRPLPRLRQRAVFFFELITGSEGLCRDTMIEAREVAIGSQKNAQGVRVTTREERIGDATLTFPEWRAIDQP